MAASPPGSRRAALSLPSKLILFSVALAAVAIAAVFVALSVTLRRQSRDLLADALARQQAMILSLQAASLEQLLRTSTLMTESPTLRAAMETYASESAPDPKARGDLLATIQSEAGKTARAIGRTLLIVTDARGRVLAAAVRGGRGPAVGEELADRGIVRQALEQEAPVGGPNFSILEVGDGLYRVGCVPILLQGYIIGTLTLGDRIDRTYAEDLRRTFGGELAVLYNGRMIASTLPGNAATLLRLPAPAAAPGEAVAPEVVRLGREEYVTAALRLGTDETGRAADLYLFHSLTRALDESSRPLLAALVLYGAAAAGLIGLGAWMVSRSVLRPLDEFVAFMRGVTAPGEEQRRFDDRGAGPEIRTLADAYHQLMDRLAEHERALLSRAREEVDRIDRLKESEKLAALGRMLSGAAHEINNPLTGVVGNIEMLLGGEPLPEPVRRRLETVRLEGQRIVALVRNLLRTARRDTGERAVVDLHRAVRDAAALRQHDFSRAGVALRLDLDPGLILVPGSALELQQVVLNILNNAFDALQETNTPRPGITLTTARGDGEARLAICDNGPGMKDPAQVFDHFYTTKPVGKGTGLGLSISQAIIRSHGGRIAAGNLPGGGAEFRIALPLAAGSVDAAAAPETRAARDAGRLLDASVLVVDDEPVVLQLQLAILDSIGARARGVDSAARAIALLEERGFDLIVTDLQLASPASGKELYEWVRLHRPEAVRGFLFLTADTIGEAEFLERARRPCLQKPFTMEEYVATLKATLRELRHAA